MRKFCFILVLESIKQEIYWSDLWLNFQNVGFFQYFLLVAMFVGILPLNVMFHKISLKKTTTTEWIFFFGYIIRKTHNQNRKTFLVWNTLYGIKLNLQGAVERYHRNPMGVLGNWIGKLPGRKLEKEIRREFLTIIGNLLHLSFFKSLIFLNFFCSSFFSILSFLFSTVLRPLCCQ